MVKVPYEKAQAEVVTYNNEDVIATFSGWCIFTNPGRGIICPLFDVGLASVSEDGTASDDFGPTID
jgi:hypothetical protein